MKRVQTYTEEIEFTDLSAEGLTYDQAHTVATWVDRRETRQGYRTEVPLSVVVQKEVGKRYVVVVQGGTHTDPLTYEIRTFGDLCAHLCF